MKLQVLQEEFVKALNLASRFVSLKAQLPVLNNILLSVKGNKMFISSTNLEISTNIHIGAKIESDGEITVPAKVINEIISNLNPGQINLETKEESIKIICNDFESTIQGMNSSDFPVVPKKLEQIDISIPKEDLVASLSQVLFAVSNDETRPILTGVLIICQKKDLTLVSTDGFRLSQRKIKADLKEKTSTTILPKSVLSELTRLPNEGNIDINFDQKNNQVVFRLDNIILSSRTLEGEFPDYKKIIPQEFVVKVLTDKEDLLRAVKLASIFARDSANIIKINVGKNNLEIVSESQLSGNQKNKVEAKIDGENLEIAFNYHFLEEILQAVTGEDVQMEFSGPSSPAVFKDIKNADFLHLIMPVKLQD